MTKKYGVGILGAGWVAGEYVKAFRDHPLTEIRGIYSHTPGKAGRLLKQHGVEAREYSSEDELFNDDSIKILGVSSASAVSGLLIKISNHRCGE